MSALKHVALVVETSGAYTRGLLHGVVRYARERHAWRLTLTEHQPDSGPPAWFADWKGDGIIARISNKKVARAVRATGRPAIDMSDPRLLPDLPFVKTDDTAVAGLAAAHFIDRGLAHFAFCGHDRFLWSKTRADRFRTTVRAAGYEVHEIAAGAWGPKVEARFAGWVAGLPKPVGVFACNDARGREVLDACRLADVSVPGEVAVLGVDNDELLCDLSDPPLSSIIPDTDRIGYQAAELLDRMMAGEAAPPRAHLIPPIGVATRQSSDVLAIPDKAVAEAVRYIRRHACEGVNVEDVLKAVPVSRRALEQRFTRALGRTPHQEILRVRLERVRSLLLGSRLPLETVAVRSGFGNAEYLIRIFKERFGVTPGHYRANTRNGER